YIERAKQVEGQKAIYYIIVDNLTSAAHSPHLDPFKSRGLEVLFLTETVDGFFVNALHDYQDFKLVSVDAATLDLEGVGTAPEEEKAADPVEQDALDKVLVKVRNILGESIESVRVSKVLSTGSPVRLVAPEGSLDRHTQRVYQLLDREFEVPLRILELNPRHTIIRNLAAHLEQDSQDEELVENTVKLLYENALLADGIHPNPSEMVSHIQKLLEVATRL
ncbi:MAG: molecular chaperone HtpG, partial [Anaerolineae bacterium]|nr:molecular chaperone HtpG [Anaerolineae bacterium]